MSAITFSIESNGTLTCHHYRGTSMSFGTGVTLTQIVEGMKRREAGALIQDAMPFLDVDQREFIISGLTPEMWEECFGAPKMYFL
ncbi:MAG: hypothetical protein ACYTFX_09635 [Planctomycetota bacterium]|jgi:hypothetical protein